MYTPGTITNSQTDRQTDRRHQLKETKEIAAAKVRSLVELGIL